MVERAIQQRDPEYDNPYGSSNRAYNYRENFSEEILHEISVNMIRKKLREIRQLDEIIEAKKSKANSLDKKIKDNQKILEGQVSEMVENRNILHKLNKAIAMADSLLRSQDRFFDD